MHLNIVANSFWWFTAGLCLCVIAGLATVVLLSPWPLLLILVALPLAFRLQTDQLSSSFHQLNKSGAKLSRVDKELFGVVEEYLVHGKFTAESVAGLETLISRSANTQPAMDGHLSIPGLSIWLLADVRSLTFASDGRTLSINTASDQRQLKFTQTPTRDAFLKLIKPACAWRIDKEHRRVFKFNWFGSLACVAAMFFSLALVFTAAGLIQPQQLPLMQWNNLKNVRGKGGGWLAIWVLLCEGYLFVVNTLPPPLTLAIGAAVTALCAIVLYLCQWTRVADVTWTNPQYR